VAAALAAAPAAAQIASFQGLGDLPGGEHGSVALAVSGDGRVVVGYSRSAGGDEAFRWSGGVMTGLGGVPGEERLHTLAHAVSRDGAVVVGSGLHRGTTQALRWQDGTVTVLGDPSRGVGVSDAWGVSADGLTIVGEATLDGRERAVAWRESVLEVLADPAGAVLLRAARAVSADGSVIVGSAGPAGAEQVFHHARGRVELLTTPEGRPQGLTAHGLSADGGSVVGVAATTWGTEGFLWRSGAAVGLGGLAAEHEYFSAARAASADGSVVVGSSEGASGGEAFLWDPVHGMRSLREVLVRRYRLDLTGWTLREATGVSDDGRTIVGYGRNPDGHPEGWIARLPATGADPAAPGAAGPVRGEHRRTLGGLRDPQGVAVDGAGTFYIACAGEDAVRVLDAAGRPLRALTVSGGSPAGLSRPAAVAVGPAGSLVVLDSGNDRVVVYGRSGEPRYAFGGRGDGPGRLRDPRGLAVDRERIAVADTGNDRVQVFDHRGRLLRVLGRSGGGPGELRGPTGVAFDGGGGLWVADTYNHRVQRFDAGGAPLAVLGQGGPGSLLAPAGLAWRAGELHVVDSGHHRIQVFGAGGELRGGYGAPARTPREGHGRLRGPQAVAIAAEGSVVVCEPGEDRCQVLTGAAGSDGPAAGGPVIAPSVRAGLGPPMAVAGRLLAVARPLGDVIDLLDLEAPGEPALLAVTGGHGPRAGQFIRPSGLALDLPRRRLLTADGENLRLQVFELEDEVLRGRSPVAGPAPPLRFLRAVSTAGMFAALRPGPGALPTEPGALTVDGEGAVFLLDRANRAVILLDPELSPRLVVTGGGPFDPVDLAFDTRHGRLLVLDGTARRVVVFDRQGRAGGGFPLPMVEGGAARPRGIAADGDGTLWVVDDGPRVLHLDREGRLLKAFGRPGVGRGELHKPRAVGLDGRGRVVVLDGGNHRVMAFSRQGDHLGVFGGGLYARPARVEQGLMPGDRPPETALADPFAPGPGPPAAPAGPASAEVVTGGGAFLVQYFVVQGPEQPMPATGAFPKNELFTLWVRVLDGADRRPLSAEVELAVDAAMPLHRHGMTTRPQVRADPDGGFTVRGLLLHMAGDWQLYFDVTRGGLTERAQVAVTLE
jgi:probable HAF family extracellular repeat protein